MQERRQQIRVKTPVLIEFPNPVSMKTERTFTQDVSDTGVRFPTEVKLQVGQELPLTFELPYERTPFHATGRVIWIREISRMGGGSQYDVGLTFRWIEDPDRNRLERFLQTVFTT